MNTTEEASRWERWVHPLTGALEYAFGCRHENLSRVFTISGRTYKVCCDCGADFDYSLQKMAISPDRDSRPALRRLRERHT